MQRVPMTPRENWESVVHGQGLAYSHTDQPDGSVTPYWNESAAYEFTLSEVLDLEKDVEELHRMSVEAARFLADEALHRPDSPFARLSLPPSAVEYATHSLARGDLDLYGRFDLIYKDPSEPAKMLEYNADTPTGLVEAAVVQWYWLRDKFPASGPGQGMDQWNGIFEALTARWSAIRAQRPSNNILHFAYTELDDTGEDLMTVAVLRDCAEHAGWFTEILTMSEIGLNLSLRQFVDHNDLPLSSVFKLYPWEDMMHEDFGSTMAAMSPDGWYEPAWKMFLSTKMLPAALWHLYPGHKNLLPTFVDGPRGMAEFVKKPLHGREGDNIEIHSREISTAQPGRYGAEGYVYQQWCPAPNFPGERGEANRAVVGAWTVGDECFGAGVRESDGPVTDYYCRFVPNVIRG